MWVAIGSGEGTGISVHVQGERFLVGSGEECQLRLGADPDVAALHAYFEVGPDGRVLLHDLGSHAGTLVNGTRIDAPAEIRGGEHIRIGATDLVPSVDDPEQEARERAAALLHEDGSAPVRVMTDDELVEVAPAGEHRRLRERTRVAMLLAALAGLLGIVAIVFLVARSGGTSTADIVSDARARTVLVDAKVLGGESIGSGFVLDAERGLIVTNFHVVNGGSNLVVGLNGDERDASLYSAAPCDDLALLRVSDTHGMKSFPLAGQNAVKEGDHVVAVGYPANAAHDTSLTSTAGVVSLAHSSFNAPSADAPSYPNVIQTDAALNPGNSGGPLIDDNKEVVGVNAATLLSEGHTPIQGQGYAIGVDRVKEVLAALRTGRSQGFGGFGLAFPRTRKLAGGALAVPMVPSGPLGNGPFVLDAVNGARLNGSFSGYCDAVRSVGSGQTAVLTLQRRPGSRRQQVPVKFG